MLPAPLKVSRADARRALVAYQLRWGTLPEVFERLRSIQFDPLSPAGSNHDLVLQARVKNYKIGDWQTAAYKKRLIYDGWDKQASLIPYSGWHPRRIIYDWSAKHFDRVFKDHPHAIDAVLQELTDRGPLLPRDFTFQEKKPEWRGSWHGPNLTKQTLRALWHTGKVMTHSRRGQHHVYDLTDRVVPAALIRQEQLSHEDAMRELVLDRHKATGILRPNASYEMWATVEIRNERKDRIKELVDRGEVVPIDIGGAFAHVTPEFLPYLEDPEVEDRVVFLGPLDQILWDRKLVNHLFGFDYLWEVYKPESLRKWGYYVLPVLFGDRFVARFDVWSRHGEVEIKSWHWEPGEPKRRKFWTAYQKAMKKFMAYCRADRLVLTPGVDPRLAISDTS
jgi:uncharacterized protein YcaQ